MEEVSYDSSMIRGRFPIVDKPATYYMYIVLLHEPKLPISANVTLVPEPAYDDEDSKVYSMFVMMEAMTLFQWAGDWETFSIPRGEDVRGEIERRIDAALPWAVPDLVQKYYEREKNKIKYEDYDEE